jgi:regulator of protease activity HflC (stomatin/prohibitin superfamily)
MNAHPRPSTKRVVLSIGLIATGLFLLILVFVLIAHVETVDAGEACVVTKWGKQSGEAGPGFHIQGFGESFHCFNSRLTTYEAGNNVHADYTDDVVKGPTADGQEVQISYRISFLVPHENVGTVYTDVAGDMDEVNERVVEFYSRPKVRQIAQGYTAAQLYGGTVAAEGDGQGQAQPAQVKLIEVEKQMFAALEPLFASKGIKLVDLELGKPEFSPEYVAAVQEKQLAEENIQTEHNKALAAKEEANRTAILAEGDARAKVADANAEATAIAVKTVSEANAEATAIAVKGAAIQANPEVLQLELIQSLDEANVIYLPNDGITQIIGVDPQPTATP